MDDYGPNGALVEAVFSFVRGGRLLTVGQVLATTLSVRDIQRAKRLAWEESYGASGYTWTDIREREMALLMGIAPPSERFHDVRDKISASCRAMLLQLKKQLRNDHAELLDDVYADLRNCALKRAIGGSSSGIWEDIFAVYEAGGWPCGWDGNYPNGGRLAAYYPVLSEK